MQPCGIKDQGLTSLQDNFSRLHDTAITDLNFGKWGELFAQLASPQFWEDVALPPSSAARSQVDQEKRRGYHKIKLQNYHSARFKCTKRIIHPLQPSCDAQNAAICRQVDQMGHTSQQYSPPIRERLSSDAQQFLMENKT